MEDEEKGEKKKIEEEGDIKLWLLFEGILVIRKKRF